MLTTLRKESPHPRDEPRASAISGGAGPFTAGKGAHAAPQVDATATAPSRLSTSRASADPSPAPVSSSSAGAGAADGIHPQTRAAWERAAAPSKHRRGPLPPASRFALEWPARCDAAALVRLRQRCASGDAERDLAVLDEMAARADRERLREQNERIAAERARLVGEHGGRGPTPERRASAWLEKADANSSYDASQAVLGVVRGFALGDRDGRALIELEYAPRFYRKFMRGELDGWVRRAMHANKPWGWKLTEARR